jgi:hypothetical protein
LAAEAKAGSLDQDTRAGRLDEEAPRFASRPWPPTNRFSDALEGLANRNLKHLTQPLQVERQFAERANRYCRRCRLLELFSTLQASNEAHSQVAVEDKGDSDAFEDADRNLPATTSSSGQYERSAFSGEDVVENLPVYAKRDSS